MMGEEDMVAVEKKDWEEGLDEERCAAGLPSLKLRCCTGIPPIGAAAALTPTKEELRRAVVPTTAGRCTAEAVVGVSEIPASKEKTVAVLNGC